MTNRTALRIIVIALGLIIAIVNYKLFPRVEVARNTTTVNHDYQPAKPAPQPNFGPPLSAKGCKSRCGGGGIILIGG